MEIKMHINSEIECLLTSFAQSKQSLTSLMFKQLYGKLVINIAFLTRDNKVERKLIRRS